nr:ANTAR domain-containing protein [Actinospica robiniae]
MATIGILAQRSREQADLVTTQLQTALNSRISIEQAKGVIAERHRIKLDEAFTILRRHARDNNLRMSDLARDVANGSPLPTRDETLAARAVDHPETSPAPDLWPVHPPDHSRVIRATRTSG